MRRRGYGLLATGVAALAASGWAAHRVAGAFDDAPATPAPAAHAFASADAGDRPTTTPSGTIRCAVIGGMTFTGFWQALTGRYEQQTGVRVEVRSSGEKDDVARAFKAGNIDVITMHACDTVVNLVADGYATDPQPWMRNDLVIVGPAADPAGVRGTTDAAAALRKIVAAKVPFVIHASLGAQEVLRNICNDNGIKMNPEQTTILLDDPQRQVLHLAATKGAYTIVGRIPFRTGRIPSENMAVMVEGDLALRRPYVVAVADPARLPGVRREAAARFARFLRSPQTQAWIADYGRGVIDDGPLFFPVEVPSGASR